ncbi:condensation domain-containing protein, partial [Maribacter sp. 2-571]|uniref:condensation domain-containing protein n=1 Tax=Maribacter sp. 2-571 TaxID=3417569 RepID=UPI003D342526
FIDLIKDVHRDQVDAQSHRDFPFEQLLDHLSIERDPSRHPLFQVLFDFQSFGENETDTLSEYLQPAILGEDNATEKYDLSIFMDDSNTGIAVQISYATSLFAKETIERMARHYLTLLERLVADVTSSYLSHSLLDTSSYRTVVHDWNATDVEYPKGETVVSLFEAQVESTPEAIA